MMTRAQELCRKLKPILGTKIDRLWSAYLAEADAAGKADVEQTLELLAAKHLGQSYQPDRSPFPPPDAAFARSGDIPIGDIWYGKHTLGQFRLRSVRLKEHVVIAGRSGSGKTNLTFVLMQGAIQAGVKVLAIDWKRGYRDLLRAQPDLRIYTIGRNVSPLRFNPLIPPQGCEPHVWIKLIVDVIASAYLGGEGVISLLVAGLDKLFREAGAFDGTPTRWPTVQELLVWLAATKLRGRAAMWQASAERILLAMTYGEFGEVVNAQDNSQVADLLNHNVVLEMDGLSSNSDRTMFSEALTLYLYRYRLAAGPQDRLTNLIILEEAHNLLLQKGPEARESILENSIRTVRQYGLGYVFVDQSASLLSKVAFANSYATLALSQKLRQDVQAISSAMNLTDEQKEALSTLPIGSVVVRLADEHPEPFLVKVPRFPIREGIVADSEIQGHMSSYPSDSETTEAPQVEPVVVSPIPLADKEDKTRRTRLPHPPAPDKQPEERTRRESEGDPGKTRNSDRMSREETRFLADVAARPLSTTVSRYERLNLSRRRGNAVRQHLAKAGIIETVGIATRSGQVVLYQLTELGRALCPSVGIEPGPHPRESLEHQYWVRKAAERYQSKGYEVTADHTIPGNGAVDLLAERPGERVAIEVETGKSDLKANLIKTQGEAFDAVVLVATSPAAVTACQRAIDSVPRGLKPTVDLLTWLDMD